jgi:hypothetical protein
MPTCLLIGYGWTQIRLPRPGEQPAPPFRSSLMGGGVVYMEGEGCHIPWDVTLVDVHPTVKAIKGRAFY